ncbi:hypothetical protein ACFYO0_35750 [Streptomyces sp. NPDC006365]|uniref:NucA/NucB deoxyribonuclease domain-containing protein n=1 Tax=Streptomyces sp. NPDC006365 TaxID=3364744 RepID=UPI0036C4D8B6
MRRTKSLWAAVALAFCTLLLLPTVSLGQQLPETATPGAEDTQSDRITGKTPNDKDSRERISGKAPSQHGPDATKPDQHGEDQLGELSKETRQQARERTDFVAKLRAKGENQRAAIQATPSTCESAPVDTDAGAALDHMTWCKITHVVHISEECDENGCDELGWMKFRMTVLAEGGQGNNPEERNIVATVRLDQPEVIKGVPRMTDILHLTGSCSDLDPETPTCEVLGSAHRTLAEWQFNSTAYINFISPDGGIGIDNIAEYAFGFELKGNRKTEIVAGDYFRCDSASYMRYNYGCVFHVVEEVFDLTADSRTQESADLIWTAQNNSDKTFPVSESTKKIPGSVNGIETLTRTAAENISPNRTKSQSQCRLFFGEEYTRGERQCDEYPQASTNQGARKGGEGYTHFAVKPINGTHNRNAGTDLGDFYEDQRILRNQDPFYVKVVNPDGSEYKGPREPSGVATKVSYRQCPNNDLPEVKEVETKAPPEGLLLNYAKNTPDGWTGGDSTYSFRLPDGRQLYLFSDTFLGPLNADGTRPTSAKFINSSFVIRSGDTLTTVHGGSKSNPKALMPPAIDNRWYWLGVWSPTSVASTISRSCSRSTEAPTTELNCRSNGSATWSPPST